MEGQITKLLTDFKELTKSPESFLWKNTNATDDLKRHLKAGYDLVKSEESKSVKSSSLPELITAGFDLEQIWQQLELQNDGLLTRRLADVSRAVAVKERLAFPELHDVVDEANVETSDVEASDKEEIEANDAEDNKVNDDEENNSISNDVEAGELSFESDDDDQEVKPSNSKKNARPSEVDDAFFKLDEMEAFLKAEEKRLDDEEMDSGNDSEEDEESEAGDDEEVDYFAADDGDMETNDTERGQKGNPRYKDFFRDDGEETPAKRRRLSSSSDDEGGEADAAKSALELRQERLKERIEEIEESAVGEKPWQLKGEITAGSRPQNSLLEEVVEFDLTARPAPVITEETNLRLEDIIRQRIKDKAFDSVERKEKPVETPLEYRKKLVLEQEKSKESLAQIYEKEYLKQKEALDPNAEDKEEEEPELHKEIRRMMRGLFVKLDALSNFHFTPKAAAPEMKVVSNLPAVTMEEVAPLATSDAALLAPEEIKGKTRGDIIGKGERTDTDKKRERRKKKEKQKKHALIKQKKLSQMKPGLGNKYSKEKAKKLLDQVTKDRNVDRMDESGHKAARSSTAFFAQLQDEVASQIKSQRTKKATKASKLDAKKLKL